MRTNGKRAFTIVELITVVAILLLLMGAVTAAVSGARRKAKNQQAITEAQQLTDAIAAYENYARPGSESPLESKATGANWKEATEANLSFVLGNEKNPLLFLTELQDFINRRHEEMPEGSYTTSLFKDGVNRIAQKVGEEALETVIEATNGTSNKLVYEASDMIYHLIVLLTSKGLRIEDVAAELAKRHDPNWDKKRREAKAKGEME